MRVTPLGISKAFEFNTPCYQFLNRLEDGVIRRYNEHEDSVYAVEWSNSDPWVFASLSYDGRLVINTVPRSCKYKILL